MPDKRVRVLVVDDEQAVRSVLEKRLAEWDLEVRSAASAEEALRATETGDLDIAILDLVLPGVEGLDLLSELRRRRPDMPIILITAHATVDRAVEAMKEGAVDFLTKPLDYDELQSVLDSMCRQVGLRHAVAKLTADLYGEGGRFGKLVGNSRPMRRIYRLIDQCASSDAPVLITGASGTGKELVAQTLHSLSPRAERDFVAINSAAIPAELIESEIFGHEKGAFTGAAAMRKGCFELAHEGTLFFDEIAEMPIALQPKLLRVLENGSVRRLGSAREFKFDVRVLAATNQDPETAIAEGRLREDLFYRLNVFHIEVPPLRERADDVPLLGQYFVGLFNRRHGTQVLGISDQTLEWLNDYDWPGNVRELSNIVQRAVVLAKEGWIERAHLPPYLASRRPIGRDRLDVSVGMSMAEVEREVIVKTLEATGGNKAEAARRLEIDVKTLRNKLNRYRRDNRQP